MTASCQNLLNILVSQPFKEWEPWATAEIFC